MPGIVTVSVPARPEFVHIMRAVTAGVAARSDLAWDGVEDLSLAVDESCAQLLAVRSPSTRLALAIEPSPDRIELVVSNDAGRVDWPPAGLEESFSWLVLRALLDVAHFEERPSGPALRLVKRIDHRPADRGKG